MDVLLILSVIVGLASLVCWIMVLIKMFSAEGALKGILGIICGLYAFIWGWMNSSRFNLKSVMIVWSICIVVSIILNAIAAS